MNFCLNGIPVLSSLTISLVPRNFPSVMNHIIVDIKSFAEKNNMEMNPSKCKDMIVDFLHFQIVIGETFVD